MKQNKQAIALLYQVIALLEQDGNLNLNNPSGSIVKPNPDYTTKKPKLYPKNVNLLEKILKVNTNTNTEAFLTSILNNNYPTVTQGQQDVIVQLANQYNLSNDEY